MRRRAPLAAAAAEPAAAELPPAAGPFVSGRQLPVAGSLQRVDTVVVIPAHRTAATIETGTVVTHPAPAGHPAALGVSYVDAHHHRHHHHHQHQHQHHHRHHDGVAQLPVGASSLLALRYESNTISPGPHTAHPAGGGWFTGGGTVAAAAAAVAAAAGGDSPPPPTGVPPQLAPQLGAQFAAQDAPAAQPPRDFAAPQRSAPAARPAPAQ
eukprot:gene8313-19620_t